MLVCLLNNLVCIDSAKCNLAAECGCAPGRTVPVRCAGNQLIRVTHAYVLSD